MQNLRYTLQVNTGSFAHTAASASEIAAKLDRCFDRIDVVRVIYGWSPDRALNEEVTAYLAKRGVDKYLWLPIFCEIHDPQASDAFVDIQGAGNHMLDGLCQGESFDFVCQSSERNIDHAIRVYHDMTDALPVEGVFIDRIRYASAANSVRDLYGCWCPRCRQRYQEAGVDVPRIQELARLNSTAPFMPAAVRGCVYQYENPDIDALMRVKRETIGRAAQRLCAHFRAAGKKIGIDTFASGVADFVGQDLEALGGMVDFIKPMAYLRTQAPAGVPFEVGALGEEIAGRMARLGGAEPCSMDAAIRQIKALMDTGASVAPGIDVNRIDPICSATPQYVLTYLRRLEEIGCDQAVLAWDAMRMSDEVLDAIAGR